MLISGATFPERHRALTNMIKTGQVMQTRGHLLRVP
jgi:hypothetical protein